MADKFAFSPREDLSNRLKKAESEGFPEGFDTHSTAALRRARMKSGHEDIMVVRSAIDYDHLHAQGHLDEHPHGSGFHGEETEGKNGEPEYEVRLKAHAKALWNKMKS